MVVRREPSEKDVPVRQAQGRLSGAKALSSTALYGTAKPVPFVRRVFSIQGLKAGSLPEQMRLG